MTPEAISSPKRILFSLLGDRSKASSRVRGYWIGDALADQGHHVTYRVTKRRKDFASLVLAAFRHDVVIFQKTHSRYALIAQRIMRAMGKRVFFDIDDAPARDPNSVSHNNALAMMRRSHGVFAGSHNLAQMAEQTGASTHFIPSGIQLENYRVTAPFENDPPCLGWIGNGAQYSKDLIAILQNPLRDLAKRRPIRLKIVGACGQDDLTNAFGDIPGLTLDLVDQVDWTDPNAVADAVADFDIGLYPLLETEFNIYKCAFKALEYMASGLPVIASNVGANGDVVTQGVDGFLVSSDAEWTAALSQLLADPARRKAMGQAGRAKVEADYSTVALAHKIAEIL